MRRWWSLLLSVLLLLSVAAPASASPVARTTGPATSDALVKTSVTWTPSTPGLSLIWDATAFAASTGQLVQFGGTDLGQMPTSTRLFNPKTGAWTTLAAPRTGWPQARTLSRMAWDPVHGKVIMFGGRDRSGVALQDTWAFDPVAKAWTQLVPSCRKALCPPARLAHGMVWSSALQRILVFGGEVRLGVPFLNDVWAFDGTSWTKLTTTNPPAARMLFGMADDPTNGKVVVFGGLTDPTRDLVTDLATWVLDPKARTWTRLATTTVPQPRAELGMAWLGTVGAVVIATGGDGSTCMSWTNSSWAFTGADWRQLSASGAVPTPRNEASLTANPLDGSALLIGGTGDNQYPLTMQDRAWILR